MLALNPALKGREVFVSKGPTVDPHVLLTQVRQGQAESLGPLLQLYRNYLALLARTQIDAHLQGRVDPSDVVQETYLEAYRGFDKFRGQTEHELMAWLRQILVNNLASLVEKNMVAHKRDVRREVSLSRRIHDLESSSMAFDRALVANWSNAEEQAGRREMCAILADQLAQLPDDYRQVIELRNLQSLPFEEVARRMNRKAGAVRMLWLRALERLKTLLQDEGII